MKNRPQCKHLTLHLDQTKANTKFMLFWALLVTSFLLFLYSLVRNWFIEIKGNRENVTHTQMLGSIFQFSQLSFLNTDECALCCGNFFVWGWMYAGMNGLLSKILWFLVKLDFDWGSFFFLTIFLSDFSSIKVRFFNISKEKNYSIFPFLGGIIKIFLSLIIYFTVT